MMEAGYVLDFSDRAFSEFFSAEVGVNINDPKYYAGGGSKAKRLKQFLLSEPNDLAARAVRALWDYRQDMEAVQVAPNEIKRDGQRCLEIVERWEGTGAAFADAINRFAENATLDELVAALQRDIRANKPQVALDRLHTYCMKRFAHLLQQRGEGVSERDTLNGRAGRYFNPIRRDGKMSVVSEKIMRSIVETFEQLNSVRNNESLAHDNELMAHAEARFVFDSVLCLLRFVQAIEKNQFESRSSLERP